MSRLATISREDETIPRHAATRHSLVKTQNNEGDIAKCVLNLDCGNLPNLGAVALHEKDCFDNLRVELYLTLKVLYINVI